MAKKGSTYTWGGRYAFRLTGTGLHEDTLRIPGSYRKGEETLKLVLPTLCITYADMEFQNAVGGEQENYPASQAYGPVFFDPPVELIGEQEIERYTYIRGAHRVTIGPRETVIEFPTWKDLVIPRLRIDQEKPTEVTLDVPETPISVDEPLTICVLQYADGRHIGGVRMEKRHPEWKPPEEKEVYDLWLRVIDGVSLQPLPEVMVGIWHWDPKVMTPYGAGGFRLDDTRYTDGNGGIHVPDRPGGELEAFVVRLPGKRATVRCLRPLAGQRVRFHMRVWPLTKDSVRYVWRAGDTVESMAQLTGHPAEVILRANGFRDASELRTGMEIALPCYAATYCMEPWDTLEWVGQSFGYEGAKGLAEANGLADPALLYTGTDIKLPGWRFFYARGKDTLEDIDDRFGLPTGSTITVGRAFHPDSRLPYVGETIAVPTARFAEKLKKRREG